MTLPAPPTIFSVQTQESNQALLTWQDNASNEDGYLVQKVVTATLQIKDHFPSDEVVFLGSKGLSRTLVYRKALSAGDARELILKDRLAANTETKEYLGLTAITHCYRVRSFNTDGDGVTEIKCLTVPECGQTVPPINDLVALPHTTVKALAQKLEPVLNKKLIVDEPCEVCPIDSCVTLDLSVCQNFHVIAEEDINCIQIINSVPGKSGCVEFKFLPCADEIARTVCGWPKDFGFDGSECDTSISSGCALKICFDDEGDGPRIDGPPVLLPTTGLVSKSRGKKPRPLKLTCANSACEIDCSTVTKSLKLTVTGGSPPYTWAATYGDITVSEKTDSAVLASVLSTIGAGGTATPVYAFAWWFMNRDVAQGPATSCQAFYFGPVYDCYDTFQSCVLASEVFADQPACDSSYVKGGINVVCSGPPDPPSVTSFTCTGVRTLNRGQTDESPYTYIGTPTSKTGKIQVLIPPAQAVWITNGCTPCGWFAGSVVTVTDNAGKSVSKSIQAKLPTPTCP